MTENSLQKPFVPKTQFLESLKEVFQLKEADQNQNTNIYLSAAPATGPGADYLKQKRQSVFHKAFDKNQIKNFKPPVHEKSDADKQSLIKAFEKSFLTKNLETSQHEVLALAMYQKIFQAGEPIITYGDVGSDYFILAEGEVKVLVYEQGADPKDPNLADKTKVTKLLESTVDNQIGFGEIALLYNDKRTASVVANKECKTWVMAGDVFKQIVASNAIQKRDLNFSFLDQVDLLRVLDKYEKMKLIDGLQSTELKENDFVFH